MSYFFVKILGVGVIVEVRDADVRVCPEDLVKRACTLALFPWPTECQMLRGGPCHSCNITSFGMIL